MGRALVPKTSLSHLAAGSSSARPTKKDGLASPTRARAGPRQALKSATLTLSNAGGFSSSSGALVAPPPPPFAEFALRVLVGERQREARIFYLGAPAARCVCRSMLCGISRLFATSLLAPFEP